MTTVVATRLGQKGRVVIPAETRARLGWDPGTTLVLTEDADELRVMSADAALARFRASVAGTPSPVDELIAERRLAAARGD